MRAPRHAALGQSAGAGRPLHLQDAARRRLGRHLDALGLGPSESPFRVVFAAPGVTLRDYGADAAHGPVVLIVPAPIKRPYIWDLRPGASAVRQCVAGGLRVYLLHWEPPGAREQGFGLAEYADRLVLDCLQAIAGQTGQSSVFLAGHSLGGTFSAIFAALHPARVRGLVLVEAPIHFGPDVGVFGPAVAAAPSAHLLTRALGNVPGTFLTAAAFLAAPGTFGWSRWIDRLRSLPACTALQTHLRVERWALDEMALPARLFEEVIEHLYREDRFMRGTLTVNGRPALPGLVEAPLLSVVDPRSTLVPPAAVLPLHEAARSADTQILWYRGDVGVALQHVGVLVGRNAHAHLWPEITRWMQRHGAVR